MKSTVPPSLRAFVSGTTGSGKSTLLRNLFVARYPRSIILAHTPDWGEPDALSLGQLAGRLRKVAGRDLWRIVVALDEPEEISELAELLAPRSLARRSLALAFGGVALVVDELAEIAGRAADSHITGLWRRGRHAGLTIFGGTQRPADVARIVTAMSQWLAVCATHEPADLAYFRGILPPPAMQAIDQLPPYGALLWETATRSGSVIDGELRLVRWVTPPPGRPSLDARSSAARRAPTRARA